MVRDALGTLDLAVLAQVGLFAFLLAFAAVLVYTFSLKKADRETAKHLPLADDDALTGIS